MDICEYKIVTWSYLEHPLIVDFLNIHGSDGWVAFQVGDVILDSCRSVYFMRQVKNVSSNSVLSDEDCVHPYADVCRKADYDKCNKCGKTLCYG